jgi:hypothetical protein
MKMKKFIVTILALTALGASAHGHAYNGLSGNQGLIIGGALGWVVGRSMPPQQVIVQPGQYQIISIPMYPNMTAPRVYNLGAPPYPGARAVYEERWQFEPTCNCQVKVFNQIGWN